MRILHLTAELPLAPGGSGGQTRQFHLIDQMRARGHEVTVLVSVAAHLDAALANRLRSAGAVVHAVQRPTPRDPRVAGQLLRRPSQLARGLVEPVPVWKMSVVWGQIRAMAREISARELPDVVVVSHDEAAAWARDLPGPAALLDCHNVSPAYLALQARVRPGASGHWSRAEGARFRRHLQRHLGRFAVTVAVSEEERDRLRELGAACVAVVPNGVDTQEYTVTPERPGRRPGVLFTGTMSHAPNHDGVRWLVRDVWPLVRARCPDAHLHVAGRGPGRAVLALGDDSVHITGEVADMRTQFEEATVVVVPIRFGGGSRLKVMESFAAGRPVVSTSLGVEGVPGVRPGQHALVHDRPEEFAAAIVDLLGDPARRARLAGEARRLAEDAHDWRVIGDRFEEALARAEFVHNGRGRC